MTNQMKHRATPPTTPEEREARKEYVLRTGFAGSDFELRLLEDVDERDALLGRALKIFTPDSGLHKFREDIRALLTTSNAATPDIPHLPDKPSLAALVFLYSLYALSAGAILAVGLANGQFWPAVPAAWGAFAALLSFAAAVRSKWAIKRWPWLGPRGTK